MDRTAIEEAEKTNHEVEARVEEATEAVEVEVMVVNTEVEGEVVNKVAMEEEGVAAIKVTRLLLVRIIMERVSHLLMLPSRIRGKDFKAIIDSQTWPLVVVVRATQRKTSNPWRIKSLMLSLEDLWVVHLSPRRIARIWRRHSKTA